MSFSIDPALWVRTYRDPVAVLGLMVDLLPVYAVIALGWGAVPLVFLYWLENLVIGATAIAEMIVAGLREGVASLAGMAFMAVFFVFHYGMFCFVHGTFLAVFAQFSGAGGEAPFMSLLGLIDYALNTGPAMAWLIGAVIVLNVFVLARDALGGEDLSAVPFQDMSEGPYARVLVLHIGIFVGFGALMLLGQPMIGILALIVLRVAWGMILAVRRRQRLDQELEKVDAVS